MTRCCPRLRMRWSGATDAIARCKSRSTGYARKTRSVHDWHWTCGEKPKAKGATKPSTLYMKHVQAEVTRYLRYSLLKKGNLSRVLIILTFYTLREIERSGLRVEAIPIPPNVAKPCYTLENLFPDWSFQKKTNRCEVHYEV